MEDINLYCCYSIRLRDYLTSEGVKYKVAGLNPNSKKLFWVYIKNDELDRLLNCWSKKINNV